MFAVARKFILDLIEVVIVSAVIVLPIRYFLIQPFFVQGQSMEPNFHNSDYLIIDELTYRLRESQRGEVIVFRFPQDPSQYYIKRIIGLPGETLQFQGNKIVIFNQDYPDGFLLEEEYLDSGNRALDLGGGEIILKKDEFFVLGDNRRASYDSRRWGVLPRADIIGRVWLRAWPVSAVAAFPAPNY
ncbi:MAG: signal peptidase I [bacterium]|nr:signal peptidase I [bacterium]